MEVRTIDITLPLTGSIVSIREWITGEQSLYLQEAWTKGTAVDPQNMTPQFKMDSTQEYTRRSVSVYCVSLDGDGTDILKRILGLPEEDFDAITAKIDEIRSKKKVKEEISET